MREAGYQHTFWALVVDVPPAVISVHLLALLALVVYEVRVRLVRRRVLRQQRPPETRPTLPSPVLELEPGVS